MKKLIKKISELIKNISNKGFFHLLLANIFIQAIAFASQLFVAHILLPEDLGIIKFIQTLISIFTIIGGLGLSASTLKICSEPNSIQYKRETLSAVLSFTFLGTIISYSFVVIFLILNIIPANIEVVKLAPIAFLPIIFYNFFGLFVSYYQAQKKIKQLSYFTIANKILSIVLIVILTFYFGIYGYYYAMNIGLILIIIIFFINTKKELIFNLKRTKKITLLKQHWVYSIPSLFANLLGDLTRFVDILFLNFFLKGMGNEIGMYSFALTLTILIRVLPSTVQQIANPYFSEKGNDKSTVQLLFKKYSKLLVIVIVITFIGFIIFVPFGIQIGFTKYIPSIKYLLPLAIASSIREFNQITAAALFGLGKINYTTYSQIISFIFNVILISISMYKWQFIGVAYGMIFCSIFSVLIMYLFYKKAIK